MTEAQLREMRVEFERQLDFARADAAKRIGPLEETLVEIDRRIDLLTPNRVRPWHDPTG
ncbi:MAG: hypothetical protein ACREFI_19070 [Stellaceae bacterium]